jgi:dipeptidyl aminopeptidase/acylaminoacyl peptidase
VIRRVLSVTTVGGVAVSAQDALAYLTRSPDGEVGLWRAAAGESPVRVPLDVPPAEGPLAWSPGGELLAHVAAGGSELRVVSADGSAWALARVEGTIEALQWSGDGRELLLLVLDPGGDTASPTGALPSETVGAGPSVKTPGSGMRRLALVSTDGAVRRVALGMTVWELAWRGGHRCVALASADPTENGWYHAELICVDLGSGAVEALYQSALQLGSLSLSPDGGRVAFVEGLSSDRGLTPGRMRVVSLEDRNAMEPLPPADVTWVDWASGDSLLHAGWRGLGTAVGRIGTGGRGEDLWAGGATLGLAYRPQLAAGSGLVAGVLQSDGEAPEVCTLDLAQPGRGWRPVSALNAGAAVREEVEVDEVVWEGEDGLSIEGLAWRPARAPAREALVVLAHGGPSLAWTHSHSPGRDLAAPLVAAGFTVLLPNPRGSAGRGEEFARANVGDLGGADYRDVVRGVEWAWSELFGGVQVPAGIAGGSYGGYLAALAGARGGVFSAAVAMAVISDWASYELTSANGEFVPVFLGGAERDLPERYRSLSPVRQVGPGSVPTLVIQGELDQCTPASQGVELYNALRRAGAETELVVYPGEGHAPRRIEHRLDMLTRSRGWLLKHLAAAPLDKP